MKSIKLRFMVIYLVLVFLVMIVGGTFMLLRIRSQETKKAEEQLTEAALFIEEQFLMPPDLVNLYNNLESFAKANRAQAAYYAVIQGGRILECFPESRRMFTDSSIISASGGTAKFTTSSDRDDDGIQMTWFNYAHPVKSGLDSDGAEYVVFVRMSAEPMLNSLLMIGATMFLTLMLAMLLTVFFGALLAGTLTGPIAELTKRAKEMAHGDLEHELPVNSKDEVGQLTESFNEMARELSQSMSAMANEKNKLEILINNMTDGVLAYDEHGTLIHANAACMELLNASGIEKIPFSEMMESLSVDAREIHDFAPNVPKEYTISSGDRYISASFSSYNDAQGRISGLVIVLQDITRLKKLDDMRKEFVANVSHEIRTPLTTIKSYTETLLDGALDNREVAEEFLEVINSESERMALLVKDLLELSRFDNKQMKLEFERVDLIKILRQSIRQNTVLADQKKQSITLNGADGAEFWMDADAGRINQVFNNLIGNALKYSLEETNVEVFCEETAKHYRIYVRDSGIGIPKEDIGRIFERFYRVDKARSRAMGGTGLGLAIAKEITEAHNGKLYATSALGKGTTMILRFDKNFDHKNFDPKES